MKQKIKELLTLENIMCMLIILCPIFDIASFTFRNYFKTNISVTTIIRPIIPLMVAIYILIKSNNKERLKLIAIGAVYLIYGIIHLKIMKSLSTESSYGSVNNEFQYICNFTFLIIYLIIFSYTFLFKDNTKNNTNKINLSKEKLTNTTDTNLNKEKSYNTHTAKLEKSITIMLLIYIVSIYISIFTNTSSYTYTETKTGFKGLIESGNSLSAIILLSLFIVIQNIRKIKKEDTKNEKVWCIISVVSYILVAIYLVTMLATRTGLFGVIIVTFIYGFLQIIFTKNKKLIIAMIAFLGIIAVLLGVFGSNTIKRRKQMKEAQSTLIDSSTGEVGNMTKDMLDIKNKILDGTLEDGFMSEAQKQSVLDLHKYAKEHDIAGNDLRKLQLIYNIYLVRNQKMPIAILFGNGYKTNYREMVMENELASMVLNFGIIGFILYIVPFIAILIYSVIQGIRNIKKLDTKYIMLQSALGLSLVLSWASGYVYFATSSMVVIVTISVLLINETRRLSKEEIP